MNIGGGSSQSYYRLKLESIHRCRWFPRTMFRDREWSSDREICACDQSQCFCIPHMHVRRIFVTIENKANQGTVVFLRAVRVRNECNFVRIFIRGIPAASLACAEISLA